MRVGPKAQDLVKSFEGCKLKAYMPTPNDRPTIGYGATFHADGRAVKMGEVWTQAQADDAFDHDIQKFGASVEKLLVGFDTDAAQFGAMVSFAYNLGANALGRSTLLARHKAGDWAGAAAQFLRWNKQGNTVLAGLVRRRKAEAELYRLYR